MKPRYMGDFETTTKPTYQIEGRTRVWASCLVTIEEEPECVHLSNNLDDFMKFVSKTSCDVYFHNLKFDGEFIVSWILSHGYKYSNKTPREEKTFDVVISSMGVWYMLKVYHKIWSKKIISTTFYDSLKKLPMSVSKIAKSFNLPEQKLSIDYDEYRPIGHELTEHEKQYVLNDVVIVAKALHQQFKQGLKKMTVASDGMNFFKKDVLFGIGIGIDKFKAMFPILPLEYDNDVRRSYKGGWCYVNPIFQNKRVHGKTYDVNSLYPSVMYGLHGGLPYGVPRKFEGKYVHDEKFPLYIQKLSCWLTLKRGHLPTIQLKNTSRFLDNEYIKDSEGIVDLVLTNVDLKLMYEHYDVTNIEWCGGYKYRQNFKFFRKYIDFWMKVKIDSELSGNGGMRLIAKLMLNALYGKFATKPRMKGKYPEMQDDGVVKYKTGEEEVKDPIYTALASFITSYARSYTIRNAQKNYDRFMYADTDSLSLYGFEVPKSLKIDKTELGKWKDEGDFQDGIFLRPKTYVKIKDGKTIITCAGMPKNVKDDLVTSAVGDDELSGTMKEGEFEIEGNHIFEMFTYGASFHGKLVPKRVKGGVILETSDFTIKML